MAALAYMPNAVLGQAARLSPSDRDHQVREGAASCPVSGLFQLFFCRAPADRFQHTRQRREDVNRHRENGGRVLFDRDFGQRLQPAQLQRGGFPRHRICRVT